MSTVTEYREGDSVWKKGTTWWGEPLPYLETADKGRVVIVYGDWWTRARVDRLLEWFCAVHNALRRLLGDNRWAHACATARAMREEAERSGRRLTFNEMMQWTPKTSEQRLRVEQITQTLIALRERVRKSVVEACSRSSGDVHEAVSGEPEEWTPAQLADAATRMPSLLLALAQDGHLPNPGDLVPPHARGECETHSKGAKA